MANTNFPFGIRQIGINNSSVAPTYGLKKRKVANNDTQKIYRGDGLQNLATGYVSAITAAGVPASQWAGIFVGCEYLSAAFGRRIVAPYWPGGDAIGDVDVQMVPLIGGAPQLLVAQATSTAFAFDDIGETVDITYAAGTAYTGYSRSGVTVTKATTTTATLPFRVADLWSSYEPAGQPGTDDSSDYNWVVLQFNAAQETGI